MAIGFLGLGSMGHPIAQHLIEKGNEVALFDVRDDAVTSLRSSTTHAATSPQEVADRASIVFACLPTNDSCAEAVFGVRGAALGTAIRIFVNLGTTGSEFSEKLAGRLDERAIETVDAPVSGGREGARRGTLTVMASGPEAAFREVGPLLASIGTSVVYVGKKAGLAQTLKLVNNLLSATAFAITAEGIVLGVKAGLDPLLMIETINSGSGRNSATVDKFPRQILTRNFDLGATIAILAKDLALCCREADTLGVPMRVGSAVHEMLQDCIAAGAGSKDLTTIVQQLEDSAGVRIQKAC